MAKSRNPAEVKAAKAEAKAARKAASKQRRSQLWQAFQIQRKEDKRLIPYMAGAFVLIAGASVAAGMRTLVDVYTDAHHEKCKPCSCSCSIIPPATVIFN